VPSDRSTTGFRGFDVHWKTKGHLELVTARSAADLTSVKCFQSAESSRMQEGRIVGVTAQRRATRQPGRCVRDREFHLPSLGRHCDRFRCSEVCCAKASSLSMLNLQPAMWERNSSLAMENLGRAVTQPCSWNQSRDDGNGRAPTIQPGMSPSQTTSLTTTLWCPRSIAILHQVICHHLIKLS
jgi:hypothetical protein